MSPATRWIGVVVGLLAMSVVTQVILVVTAISDPSFAVEPGWEEDAGRWDELKRREAASRELGWTAEVSLAPTSRRREARVALELYDRWGKPIRDAEVAVEAFHNARAARRLTGPLTHLSDARYVAVMPIDRPGVWEFRIDAKRGEAAFVESVRKSVSLRAVSGEGERTEK